MRPGTKGNYFTVDFRGDICRPAVAHFMPEVPNRVVVGKGLPVRGALRKLACVESYVVTAADGCAFWRPFMHFVRANIHRLREPQLESTLGAAALQDLLCLVVLSLPDSRHVASHRAVTRTTRFLIINTAIGGVGQKIKLVAESLKDCAGEVLRL